MCIDVLDFSVRHLVWLMWLSWLVARKRRRIFPYYYTLKQCKVFDTVELITSWDKSFSVMSFCSQFVPSFYIFLTPLLDARLSRTFLKVPLQIPESEPGCVFNLSRHFSLMKSNCRTNSSSAQWAALCTQQGRTFHPRINLDIVTASTSTHMPTKSVV